MEILGIMHKADPYGHLLVNGKVPTEAQIAALARAPADQVRSLLHELEEAGVFSRTRKGVIYSRRLTRDEQHRKDGETAQKLNGNVPGSRRWQALEKQAQNTPPPEVVDGVVERPPPVLEARSHVLEKRKSPTGDSPSAAQIAASMAEIWNREIVGTGLSTVTKLRDSRCRTCRMRYRDDFGSDFEQWREFVRRVTRSAFLLGNNGRADNKHPFRATFDWVLEPRNLAKIQEGNFDNYEPAERQLSFDEGPLGPPPEIPGWEVSMERAH